MKGMPFLNYIRDLPRPNLTIAPLSPCPAPLSNFSSLKYFMQEAGEPMRLRFQKGPYGPYAENLRHVLHAVEGHLIFGYADGGDNPAKQLNLVPGSIQDADAFLEGHPETRNRLRDVSELVAGFESTLGMELLSTVHWVVNNEPVASKDDIVD